MRISFDLKKITIAAGLGVAILGFGVADAGAQRRRDRDDRERQRIERQQERIAERNARRQRQLNRERQERNYRDGSVYNGGNRGFNPVINSGYQQGFLAGQSDRRRGKYNHSNVYRGTGSYPNQGDPTSADYLYRQGYLQGYEDGYRGGIRY